MFVQHPEIITEDNSIPVSLPSGKFKGVMFTLGKVALHEHKGSLRVSFQYNLLNKRDIWFWNKKRFIKEVGDCLMEEINRRIENEEEIIFYGGEGESTYE